MGHATDPMQIAPALSRSWQRNYSLSRCRHRRAWLVVDERRCTSRVANPALAEFRVNGTADNVDIIRGKAIYGAFLKRGRTSRRKVKVFVSLSFVCSLGLASLVSGTNCVETTQSSANNERDCLPFIYNDRGI